MSTNFDHLHRYDEQLFRLAALAERYFPEDPNTTLIKLRQLGELLARHTASRFGLELRIEETQQVLLRRLEAEGCLDREIAELFHVLRRKGNLANHAMGGDHATALKTLRMAWQLGVWFHRTFSDPEFRSGPFQPPRPPTAGDPTPGDQAAGDQAAGDQALQAELAELRQALAAYQVAEGLNSEQLAQTEAQLRQALREQQEWEHLAVAVEADKTALVARLAELQVAANRQGDEAMAALRQASQRAAEQVELSEAATRELIDAQLRQAGWEADSTSLRYSAGARPQKHRNLAIAEWPTRGGPADYVLFVGLTPLAAVEAKRAHTDVAGVLPQAQRYCRDFQPSDAMELSASGWGPEAEFRLPFAFASNGRPFLRQLRSKSGIWFRDLRRPSNLAVPLEGWYSPEGLRQLVRQDIAGAEAKLRREAFSFGFPLRPSQRRAIEAVEAAIAAQQREI
ncbi:MAG: type I restriction endonuclease, partial [Synechococcaceae cyanobacterium]